jgi:integrase
MARKRRGRGERSIFQRADGLYVSSVSLGYDGNGKRRRKTVYGQTKAEVQEKLRRLHLDALTGNPSDTGRLSVGEYLQRWLENTAKNKVRPTDHLRSVRATSPPARPADPRRRPSKQTGGHPC